MSELEPKVVSALDQFSGVVAQVGDMTVSHYQRLVDGKIPNGTAKELAGDMHSALLELFVAPKRESDETEQ